jgi:hypothetical protein
MFLEEGKARTCDGRERVLKENGTDKHRLYVDVFWKDTEEGVVCEREEKRRKERALYPLHINTLTAFLSAIDTSCTFFGFVDTPQCFSWSYLVAVLQTAPPPSDMH